MIMLLFTSASYASESCTASIYTTRENGTRTASGIPLSNGAMTAAHKTLKFGTQVRVTHRRTGSAVLVTITDRGPYVAGRCIDLTSGAARAIGIRGIGPVTVEVVR